MAWPARTALHFNGALFDPSIPALMGETIGGCSAGKNCHLDGERCTTE